MGGAHGVNVELFHEQDVGEAGVVVDCFAHLLVVVVAVDAFHEYGFAVDEEFAVCDFNASKSEATTGVVYGMAIGVVKGDHEGIEIW